MALGKRLRRHLPGQLFTTTTSAALALINALTTIIATTIALIIALTTTFSPVSYPARLAKLAPSQDGAYEYVRSRGAGL